MRVNSKEMKGELESDRGKKQNIGKENGRRQVKRGRGRQVKRQKWRKTKRGIEMKRQRGTKMKTSLGRTVNIGRQGVKERE